MEKRKYVKKSSFWKAGKAKEGSALDPPEPDKPVQGTCPVCSGNKCIPVVLNTPVKRYLLPLNYPGYNRVDNTIGCPNCGGQYSGGGGVSTGKVNTRPGTGEPCIHRYLAKICDGNRLILYTCKHCNDSYYELY